MDEIFLTLSDEVLNWMDTILANDDVSSDEELVHCFIENGALTREQAQKALSYRDLYLVHIFHCEHTPLRKGREGCLRWNPHTIQFEKL